MFEQESVTKNSNIRELSVGARQLFGFGEFLLLVADLKLAHMCRQVDFAGCDRYITWVYICT